MAKEVENQKPVLSKSTRKTITVKQLVFVAGSIVLVTVIILIIMYLKSLSVDNGVDSDLLINGKIEQPKHLFSIYGNEAKPLKSPMAVYVNQQGNIYVSSNKGHEIQVFKPNGQYSFTIGKPGTKPGELTYPYGITENAQGNLLISETGNQRIQEFTADGKYVKVFASVFSNIKVQKPGPLVYVDDQLYIGDLVKQEVLVVKNNKLIQTIRNVSYPHGIAQNEKGKIYISDSGGSRIAVFDQAGNLVQSINRWLGQNKFSLLRGLAIDQKGRIYVVDSIASAIRVYDAKGTYLFSFGQQGFEKGQLLYPTGIFVDKNTNRIYIADWANNRVEVWGY